MPDETGQTGGPEIEWQVGSSCTRAQRALPSHGVTPNLFWGRMAMRPPDHHERTCGIHQGGLDYWDSEGRRYVGHLVMLDHAQGPAVLLAHNTPGVDDFDRGVARRLAGPGYVVLCVDYVGTGELLSMDQVHSRFGAAIADPTLLRGAMTAGLEALIAQPSVDASRVAAIGHCLGGAAALELALSGADVAAVAVFHSTCPVTSGEQPEHQEQDPGPDRCCRHHDARRSAHVVRVKMNEAGVDWRMILTAVFRTHSPSPKH